QNIRYLQTKKDRMDHRLVLDMQPTAPVAGPRGFEHEQD
ncbi:MAG: cyclohydrolase, partial [Arthrobacter sp.]|nr:cyclohydrolase [Arthrobacter sp.]